MEQLPPFRVLARIHSAFSTKFGIPRQSGLVPQLRATVVFEPAFRSAEAVRGLEGFSHLWLIWYFSASAREEFSPTVRPPRLGGNVRMGVFATRSPFRPNPIGLSAVKLESVELHPELGPVLTVSGADLMDGTPILDIKPYVPYVDAIPDAAGGFAAAAPEPVLTVVCPPELLDVLPPADRAALPGVLAQDPRPAYQRQDGRIYGMDFAGCRVRFTVTGDTVTVTEITPGI